MKRNTFSKIISGSLLILVIFIFFGLKPEEKVDFSTQVKPILNKRCISCHGGVKKNAGLSFLFQEEAMSVTESGMPVILPGNAKKSLLIQKLHETDPEQRMPYQKEPLSKEEIDILTRWIDQGAEWGAHWAYTIPKKETLPEVADEFEELGFLRQPIDYFVAARMEELKLSPNQIADKEILARRVAFDLTGLPPARPLFDAFISSKISYENLVDSLLHSNGYGEKWASWWLDLARYADTKGYEKDAGRSIWQYRDWVIRALNDDMPYNAFSIEQLAGDLLPKPSADQLIATAFHRNTMSNDEGGTEDEEFRVASVIDRVNTTFDVWQSTTISCVQCHSHPYDPIKQNEYYQLMAFFNNSRDEDTPDEAPNFRIYSDENTKRIASILEWSAQYGDKKTIEDLDKFFQYLEPKYQLHNCKDFVNGELSDSKYLALRNNGSAYLRNVNTQGNTNLYFYYTASPRGTEITIRNGSAKGEVLAKFPAKKSKWTIAKVPFKPVNGTIDLYIESKNDAITPLRTGSKILWFAFVPELPGKGEIGYNKIEKELLELINNPETLTPIMIENPKHMQRSTHVFDRGDWTSKGEEVTAGTPEFLNNWDNEWEKNRLGLAKWIVSEENPLTARTLINRVWYQLFGRGIVSTIEDMGTQSEPPSHPALLDWMAVNFIESQDWKLKSLMRSIVLSGTYRQSSKINKEKQQIDPKNEYYARGPKLRMSAEEIRDQTLAVSGLLSKKMHGPGVMPPQPEGIWGHAYMGDLWKVSKGEDRYRRAVYTYFKRTSPYPSFMTFDAGSREVCSVRRLPTNTPLQALVTLNDPVYLEAAMNFAKTHLEQNSIEDAIKMMYNKATFKKINAQKLEVLKDLYDAAITEYEEDPAALDGFLDLKEITDKRLAALTLVANAIMNLDEFLTHA